MPINNGTNLKVQTVIGDKIYHDEEVRDVYYRRNRQSSPKPKAGGHPMDMKPYGRDNTPQGEEHEIDPAMQAAINDDLNKRGVSPKKTRKRTPKKTKPTD